MSAATIWRTCPSCGGGFEQPDDPGRTRVYCSRACQQAASRTRQRHAAGQRQASGGAWRQERQGRGEQRHQHAARERPGADGRQQWRHDERTRQRQQHQPPPGGANGQRPGAAPDERERYRRSIAALLRKAAATPYPHEAAACRAKAEALRRKYRL
jgi:hypothetical protein